MNDAAAYKKRKQIFSITEVVIIAALAAVPLFTSFPYRVNIFLSWEGAYRLSQGQIPYKDFGMPLGYMYWVIPAIFFKLFGFQMISLIKAQVFINIISGLAFRSILKNLGIQPGVRLLSVLLYCISFSFFNFWPWYNHTVIVYEMIGLAFLVRYIFNEDQKNTWIWLALSALFIFFSFFTKQDGGGLAFLLCSVLLLYNCFHHKKWKPLLIFLGSFAIVAFAIIAPLTRYNFGYWFNHGQPPHTSRFSFFEIIDEFFANSQWIKFYLFVIALLAVAYYKNRKDFITNKKSTVFLLLTLGILAQATILQITSYTPPDNNIFFHSFAFVFILSFLADYLKLNFYKLKTIVIGVFGLLLWWSGIFWKYFQRIAKGFIPSEQIASTTENIVNRNTYLLHPKSNTIPTSEWSFSELKVFDRIYMPKQTVDGIQRLLDMDIAKNKNSRVLNMTELTPLAEAMHYQLETGLNTPLWYHLGVAMFNKEAITFEKQIINKQYDIVLFEYVPTLNNFYPFRVRDVLQLHYQKIDSFPAPRSGDTPGTIEIYTR